MLSLFTDDVIISAENTNQPYSQHPVSGARREGAGTGGKAALQSPSKWPAVVRLGEQGPACPQQAQAPHLEALASSGQTHVEGRPALLETSCQASSPGFHTSPFWSCLSPIHKADSGLCCLGWAPGGRLRARPTLCSAPPYKWEGFTCPSQDLPASASGSSTQEPKSALFGLSPVRAGRGQRELPVGGRCGRQGRSHRQGGGGKGTERGVAGLRDSGSGRFGTGGCIPTPPPRLGFHTHS